MTTRKRIITVEQAPNPKQGPGIPLAGDGAYCVVLLRNCTDPAIGQCLSQSAVRQLIEGGADVIIKPAQR